jgi:hypothetical protein
VIAVDDATSSSTNCLRRTRSPRGDIRSNPTKYLSHNNKLCIFDGKKPIVYLPCLNEGRDTKPQNYISPQPPETNEISDRETSSYVTLNDFENSTSSKKFMIRGTHVPHSCQPTQQRLAIVQISNDCLAASAYARHLRRNSY